MVKESKPQLTVKSLLEDGYVLLGAVVGHWYHLKKTWPNGTNDRWLLDTTYKGQ